MKETIKKIFRDYWNNVWKPYMIFSLSSVFLLAVLETLEPLFFWKIIEELEKFYITSSFNINAIIILSIAWWLYILVVKAIHYLIFYYLITKGHLKDYTNSINHYSDVILSMSFSEYLWKRIGKIYKIFDNWVDNKLFFLFAFFERHFKTVVSVSVVFIVLLFLDIRMALISMSMIPVMIFMWMYFLRVTSVRQEILTKRWENIFIQIWEGMSNFLLLKSLTLEKNFLDTIYKKSWSCLSDQMLLNKQWNISDVYTTFLVMVVRLFVLWSWMYFISTWTLSLAELFVIFAYVWWIYFPLWGLFSELRSNVKTTYGC